MKRSRYAAALALLMVGVAGCRSGEDGGARPAPPTSGRVRGSPNADLVATGSQFATMCEYSHSASDDPIVFPREPGESHLHDFFGNTSTDAFSTARTLQREPTTCKLRQDRAAYWAPALFRGGEHVTPVSSDAYYRVAPGIDPTDVEPYPDGLMMIAGDGMATAPQPTSVVAWSCRRSPRVWVRPPECPARAPLVLRVTFPDCWNGREVDSPDHRAHVAVSGPQGCPATHPVPMPQLTFVVHYPVSGPTDRLSLSPGSLLRGHADFFNAWEREKLEAEIHYCLVRRVTCQVPGGTLGSPETFTV